MKTRLVFLIRLLCGAAASLQTIHAATITVTNLHDSGPGSLRQALAAAHNGDTINFSVTGTITLTGKFLTVSQSITIFGPGAGYLAINGNHRTRVFHVVPNARVTIAALTITNGGMTDYGGGIYNDRATITLYNCVLSGNESMFGGGGIFNHASLGGNATLSVNSCTFSSNLSILGGAISNFSDDDTTTATLSVTFSTFDRNKAEHSGGGIYNRAAGGGAEMQISDSTLSNNSADYGGGICNNGSSERGARVQIINSTLNDNSAQSGGGQGGGIFNKGEARGNGVTLLKLNDSTLSNNSARQGGGGIFNRGEAGHAILDISNSTLSGNSGVDGGGIIRNFGRLANAAVIDTILKAETMPSIQNEQGSVTSRGYNLSSDSGGSVLTAPGDRINTDPKLGPLQSNGGLTDTHALLSGSPAIDAGDPNFTLPPQFDQRGGGYPRVVNGRIDIGAFEVQ